MKIRNKVLTQFLVLAVAFTFCGGPEFAHAQQPQAQQEQQQQTQPRPGMVDPAAGPLTPVPQQRQDQQTDPNELPEAPSATQTDDSSGQEQAGSQGTQGATGQQRPRQDQPVGVGAAEAGRTAGGAASKPAGSAIAPAKQRQYRSLLIKLGAIAGAGIAIGTVLALSKGTKSTPPGAR